MSKASYPRVEFKAPGAFSCEVVWGVGPNRIIDGKVKAVIGLCPNCDNTHMAFFGDTLEVQAIMTFHPEDAEKLADMLVNPPPIPVGAWKTREI